MMPTAVGREAALLRPCIPRNAKKGISYGAGGATRQLSAIPIAPIQKISRCPSRSASRPNSSSEHDAAREFVVTIHCCRPRGIARSLLICVSSMTQIWAMAVFMKEALTKTSVIMSKRPNERSCAYGGASEGASASAFAFASASEGG